MAWNKGIYSRFPIGDRGQSTVEYLFVILIAMVSILAVFKHPRLQDFFGSDSWFFTDMAHQIEYSYRHGRMGPDRDDVSGGVRARDDKSLVKHETFYNDTSNKSRFFAPDGSYPE